MKKSGLSIQKVTKIVHALKGNADGIVASTINSQQTHHQMLRRWMTEVVETERFRKMPMWGQEAVRYYFYGKIDMLARYMVVFAGRLRKDGKLYRTNTSILKTDWPTWNEVYVEQGSFDWDLDCTEAGEYWPSGKPYCVKPTESQIAKETTS